PPFLKKKKKKKLELLWIGRDDEGDYSLYSMENPLFGPDKISCINKSGHYAHLERLPAFFKNINSYYKSIHAMKQGDDSSKSTPQLINKSIKILAEFLYTNLCSIYEWDLKKSKTDSNSPAVVKKELVVLNFMYFITEGFLIGLLELSELDIEDLINVSEDIKTLDDHMSGIECLDMEYLKSFLQVCRGFVPDIALMDENNSNQDNTSDNASDSSEEEDENEADEELSDESASMSEGEEELLMMKLRCMFPAERH
ncbi:hypothetical protein RFI_08929, partial [Reticulomyxa filosa]